MLKISKLFIAILLCELTGIISGAFTVSPIKDWYLYLNKPFFSPPNWVFGPVWTLLYFLMGVSLFMVWDKGLKKETKSAALKLFGYQLVLNFFWSIIFFGFRSPILGLVEIIILWVLIYKTIQAFYQISKPAAYLLVPYLAWVSFASILNLAIVVLN